MYEQLLEEIAEAIDRADLLYEGPIEIQGETFFRVWEEGTDDPVLTVSVCPIEE